MKRLGLAAAALILCGAGCTRPQYDGKADLPGLAQPLRIARDEHAMPAIYAGSFEDALVGQGFAMAEDRMFQLELLRHLAAGRLSELAGASTLPQDRLFRAVGLRRIAEGLLPRLKPGPLRNFAAFTRGVNGYLQTQSATLPVEYSVLGLKPEPWTLLDTLTVFVFINWNFSANLGEEVLSQRLVDHLGPTRAAELFPARSDLGPGLTYHPPHRGAQAEPVALVDPIPPRRTGLGDDPLLASIARPVTDWRLGGSNAWVVAGSRSTSGVPMLASDPHGSGNMIPVPFYPVTLVLPDLRITGIGIVGLPGVLTGRNDFLAWGFTNNNGDQQDLFIESVDPDDPDRYLENGQYVPFARHAETLRIRGSNGKMTEETLEVRETPRGPIVTELLPGLTQALSLRWYVRELFDGNLGLDEMIQARTPDEFLAALAKWPTTTQNAHIAYKGGWIGWHIMGHVPIRHGHDGLYPVPAAMASSIWDGVSFVPFDQMPHFHDPPQGWTGSANHWGYAEDFPYPIATSNAGPYRALRIAEVLSKPGKMSVEDHRALQLDTVSVLARRLLPTLLADLAGDPDPDVQALRSKLQAWDGSVAIDSLGATLWDALYRNLLFETFRDELGQDLAEAYLGQSYYFQERFERLAADPDSPWFDDTSTPGRERRPDITRRAARLALKELNDKLGADPSRWQWGALHSIFFENPIGTSEPLRSRLGAGPYPFSGDGETLQRGAYSLASPYSVQTNAAMRMVADLADDCSVLGSITTGVSGRFDSPYYKDQVEAYLSGEGVRWWTCDAEIEAHKKHELLLQPAATPVPARSWPALAALLLAVGLGLRYRKQRPSPR
jgi:penicillin G amidase